MPRRSVTKIGKVPLGLETVPLGLLSSSLALGLGSWFLDLHFFKGSSVMHL